MNQIKEKNFIVKIPVEPNWSEPRYYQLISSSTVIVISTGKHNEDSFEGMALPCQRYPKGSFNKCWMKDSFEILTDDVNYVISNNYHQ